MFCERYLGLLRPNRLKREWKSKKEYAQELVSFIAFRVWPGSQADRIKTILFACFAPLREKSFSALRDVTQNAKHAKEYLRHRAWKRVTHR